jgi:hypothetical protein
MRRLSLFMLPLLLAAVTLGARAEDDVGAATATESPWPARFSGSHGEFVVYPPRFDEWRNGMLRGRAAVSVQPYGADEPAFGMVWISARTRPGSIEHTVYISDLQFERAEFPAAPDRGTDYLAVLRQQLAAKSWQVSGERLQTDLAIERATQRVRAQPLSNDPPRILFAQRPSILVPIDGTPVLRDVEGTQLLQVINTRALLLLDKATGRYHLGVAGHWMTAASLEGPWSESRDATGELDRARQIVERQGQVELLDDEAGRVGEAPAVHVATSPTELLQTEGPPEYSPIEGTQLLYVTNSPDRIFLDLRTQRYIVLISGRWYRTADLAHGPWEFVPGNELPADFAMIPSDHPMSVVRASVPGTPQAKEAVIASDAPQIATIRREAARIELTYDGEPEFRPIEGTALHYAVNAPIPLIRVSADSYYALDNGVWFSAPSPYGTWSVATYVPAAIYGIPPSSPLHYVTYVRIYHDTVETVDVGYTAGYAGSYVSADHVVVYGSGWYYRPWVGHYWYGAPFTWGYGFSTFYTWWYPWGPPLYVVWRPYPCYRPWWGPWIVVRPGWVRGAVVHHPAALKPVRNVTRVYERWDDKVVAHRGSGGFSERAMGRKALRPGEGYIVKDGLRFDIVPPNNHHQQRTWRNEGRSRLPPIQGMPSRGEAAKTPGPRIRGFSDAVARPAARAAVHGAGQAPAKGPRMRQRERRDMGPEHRAIPTPRSSAGMVDRNPARRPDTELTTQERAQRSWQQDARNRAIRRAEAGMIDPESLMQRRAQGRTDGLQRPQFALPQRETMAAPRENRQWTRPQREMHDTPRQIKRDAREIRGPSRESSRGGIKSQRRDRG